VYTLALHAWRAQVFGRLPTEPAARACTSIRASCCAPANGRRCGCLEQRIFAAISLHLRAERDALSVTLHTAGELLQKLAASLVELSTATNFDILWLYREAFETRFLAEAELHYCAKSDALVESAHFSVAEYMRVAETLLEKEIAHARRYVHCSTIEKLRKCVESALITRHHQRIELHFTPLLAASQLSDLRRMYGLLRCSGAHGCHSMCEQLKAHVSRVASDAIKQLLEAAEVGSREAWQFVDVLVRTLHFYQDFVHQAFGDDIAFVTALEQAARGFVNLSCRSPELIARFCHVLLDKSSKLTPGDSAVIERYLADAASLLRHLEEKDVFQVFYSKLLAKRLIQDTSVSAELEECMIMQLKQSCGYEFSTKLQRMFTDKRLAQALDQAFSQWEASREPLERRSTGFSVMVLTTGSWPLSPVPALTNVELVPELRNCVAEFSTFYQTKYHGRRLQWAYHLARADVCTSYLKRPYEFQVGVLQLAMLQLFNLCDALCLSEIKARLGMADSDVRRILLSLLRPKILLLTKASDAPSTGVGDVSKNAPSTSPSPSPGPTSRLTAEARSAAAAALLDNCAETTLVSLNMNFFSKVLSVKLSTLLAQSTAAVDSTHDDCETHKTICDDRRILIQVWLLVPALNAARVKRIKCMHGVTWYVRIVGLYCSHHEV
jgi:cullin 1